MDSKVFWFGTIFLILVIGIFSYLNIAQAEPEDIQLSEVESCQSIVYSGEDRMDLLFLSTKEEAEQYSNLLFETEPFKKYKSYFNLRFIDGENPVCESYKGIAILCDTKEVQEIAKNCEHDYIFVVKDEPAHIRSSAYGNVVSLNKNVEKSVLIHEIGHAIGNLAEEYTPAKIPRGAKNCQVSCEKFGELTDSCSKECSESGLYRSIQSGVMRTLITTNYGIYNIKTLENIFEKNKPSDLSITGNQIQESVKCSEQERIPIDITQTEDSIKAESTNERIPGCAPNIAGEGEFCIGELCYPSVVFTDGQETGAETLSGEILPAPQQITIFISADNEEVPITQNGQLITTINTAQAGATACLTN